MVAFNIRQTEGVDPQPDLAWDTRWDPTAMLLDWRIDAVTNPLNPGGLQANRALDTAILLQLATWKRADPSMVLDPGEDPQGWWGDTLDLEDGETEMGSWLWRLYRSVLNKDTADKAVFYAQDCLKPILDQEAVVRFDVSADYDQVAGWLALTISGYSQSGSRIYNQRFARLWQQEFVAAGQRL